MKRKYLNLLLILITIFNLSACGQPRHKGYTQDELDSLNAANQMKIQTEAAIKRLVHPETDSLRVLDLSSNFDLANSNNYVYPRARIQNETSTITWKYKEVIFHIFINGKEIQTIPAQEEGHTGSNLSGVVPPNTTTVFKAISPVDDGKGIPTNGDSPGARWYSSGSVCRIEIIYDYSKPKIEVLTLIGVMDRSMKSEGTFNFTNNQADTAFYCESLDSCIVNGKPGALYPEQWQPSVKPEFINKKFAVTYTVDNSGGIIQMAISRLFI